MPTNVIPYSTVSHATSCAEDRQRWVINYLSGPGPQRREQQRFTVVEEPLPDRPSQHEDLPPLEEDDFEFLGQLTRLRWQLASRALLLLERATDVVIQLFRAESSLAWKNSLHVSLQRLRRARVQGSLFPWRIVVRTREKEMLSGVLPRYADFLGIGVDVDDFHEVRPLGRCQAGYGDGQEGLVGGLILDATSNVTHAVTCGHVLARQCGSLSPPFRPREEIDPRRQRGTTHWPDVALLDHGNPCHEVPPPNAPTVQPMNQAAIDRCVTDLLPVYKRHPHARRNAGLVASTNSLVSVGDTTYRFPHVSIIPRRIEYAFGMVTLPLSKHYSKPGESGAWVCGADSSWLGMVVGGMEGGVTYAVEAGALMAFVSAILGRSGPGIRTPSQPPLLLARAWGA